MTEIIGIAAVCGMVLFYSIESHDSIFVLMFALSCAVASFYAFLIGSYPFMLAEGVWAFVALRKWIGRVAQY